MISVERGLVRAFYPAHISCLDAADPIQDPEFGLVCQGCGTILGFPDKIGTEEDSGAVATPEEAHDAEGLSGQREIEPEPPEVGGGGVPYEPAEPPQEPLDDKHAAIAESMTQGDPPWSEDQDSPIQHEPVINEQPPDEADLPAPHGSASKSAVVPQDPIMAALDVIDPTRPYTPAEVESQLVDIEARLDRGQHYQRVWEERAFRTKLAYTLAYEADLVRIYNDTRAPADIRQAQARQVNRAAYEAMTLAEMMVKAVRETMHTLRSQLSGYQSICRSVGASFSGPQGYRT